MNPDKLRDEALVIGRSPFAAALGLTYAFHDAGSVTLKAPYGDHLVGDPDTGVLHGGVITALLDNACGMAVRLSDPAGAEEANGPGIATLDLRIDYMGPAAPHSDVYAKASCYKRTAHIAFVRGVAYTASEDSPVATCVASFMLSTRNSARA